MTLSYAILPYMIFCLFKSLVNMYRRGECCKNLPLTGFIVLLILAVQILTFTLKLDGKLNLQWKEAFWIYWVVFTVMIGVTFAVSLMILSKFCYYICGIEGSMELKGSVWLFSFLGGITFISCYLVANSIRFLEEGEAKGNKLITYFFLNGADYFSNSLYLVVGYNLISILLTLTFFDDLENFFVKTTTNEEELAQMEMPQLATGSRRHRAKPKEQKIIDIPRFLMRASSTYFKRASEKEYKHQREEAKKQTALKTVTTQRTRIRTNSVDYGNGLALRAKLNGFVTARDNLLALSSRSKEDEVFADTGNVVSTRILSSRSGLMGQRLTKRGELYSPQLTDRIASAALKNGLPFLGSSSKTNSNSKGETILENYGTDRNFTVREEYRDEYQSPLPNDMSSPIIFRKVEGAAGGKVPAFNPEKFKLAVNQAREPITDSIPDVNLLANNRFNLFQSFQTERKDIEGLLKSIEEEIKQDIQTSATPQAEAVKSKPADANLEKSVNQCLVCFDKQPDAVFMDCGHGGVCYECALEVWKATDECFLCRNIEASKTKAVPILKVLSSTQMVHTEQDAGNNETLQTIPDLSQTGNNV